MLDVADAADLLLNITGHLTLESLMDESAERRTSISIRGSHSSARGGHDGARLKGHDFHFTIGANIGTPDCGIPPVRSAGVTRVNRAHRDR